MIPLWVAGILSMSMQDSSTATTRTKAFVISEVLEFQAQLDTLLRLAELYGASQASRQQLLDQFRDSRLQFKRFEFMLEYLDNQRYQFFNGVNAVEADEGIVDPNVPPEGLQVLEGFLYSDSLDTDEFILTIRKLQYKTLVFYYYLGELEVKPTYVFEGFRYNLIRIEALTITGFDSPDLRNSLNEARVNLGVMHTVFGFYAADSLFEQKTAAKNIQTKLLAAEKYLAGKNFDSFDRLYLIKNFIQPITQDLAALQEASQIPYLESVYKIFRSVNLKSPTIYDKNFLQAKFYASDKYYKDNPVFIELGRKLFFDKRLSVDGQMSCANCHIPSKVFTDGLVTAITNVEGDFQERNTPTLFNAALQAGYFYDFKAATLETQVDHVVINPREFNTSYDEILKRLKADTQYVRLFGEAFPEYKNDPVSIMGVNTCIAAFERELITMNTPFDKYMRGETTVIDPAVKRGFNLFMGKAQCGTCHFAPTFFGNVPPFYGTSESEVLGVPKVWDTLNPVLDTDIGRYKFMELPDFMHAFKTSTVRNAELTKPYMHNGGFKSLEDVVDFYDRGGGAGLGLDVPNQTLPDKKLNLTAAEKRDIIAFMKALTDTSVSVRITP
jgi:cytochrome c peroxidase